MQVQRIHPTPLPQTINSLADQAALSLAGAWRKALLANRQSAEAAAQITLAIWVLHLWELRLGNRQLQQLCGRDQLSLRLTERWQGFCAQTSGRFLDLWPAVDCTDGLLKSILASLYYPHSEQFAQLSADILGQIYEQGLAKTGRQSRKSGGIYYTPQPMVEYIVRSTLSLRLAADLPQILDPACGGGAFLLTAYRYLRAYAKHSDPETLLSCLHGVDIDPQSVAISQISLWLQSLEGADGRNQRRISFLKLEQNIRCGNAVIDNSPAPSFWQTAFPKALAAGGFDCVIGNPPYMDAELMSAEYPDWRAYCAQHYQAAAGNWDLFCIFIEKALQLCQIGGLSGLIVPNKLLSAGYAAATRQLLSQTDLQSIRDYSNIAVFNAAVYPIVYISQKVEQRNSIAVQYEKMLTLEQVQESRWIQITDSTAPWITASSDLMRRLDQLPKLGSLAQISGAATVAEAYALRSLIQNCSRPQPADLRLVNSGTIDRYRCLWGQKRLRYLGQSYQHPVVTAQNLPHLPFRRLNQAQQPKLIVAGMGLRLEAMLDQTGGILAGKSTSVIGSAIGSAEINLRYLLGLLNSRLLSFYLLNCFGGNRLQGGYLQIGSPQLRQLPIVGLAESQPAKSQQIIDLVNQILNFDSLVDSEKIRTADAEIDAAVYEIYQLSESEIEEVEALALLV